MKIDDVAHTSCLSIIDKMIHACATELQIDFAFVASAKLLSSESNHLHVIDDQTFFSLMFYVHILFLSS